MILNANWAYPTSIKFGAGRIKEIAEACRAVGMKNPLFVTDRGLATTDIAQKTLDLLEADSLGRAVFADVDPNPMKKMLPQELKLLKKEGMMGLLPLVAVQVWI